MTLPTIQALDGDVLTPADDIRVVAALRPFGGDRVEITIPAGSTLAEIVQRICEREDCTVGAERLNVIVGDAPVDRLRWRLVRPKPGALVTVVLVPSGFIAAIIGAISGAIGSIGSAIAGAGFLGKLLLTGISFAAKLLMSKLFAPKQPEQLAPPKPSYSIVGSRNTARPWEAVPAILGRHRVVPALAGLPYTEQVGEDQYLRMLFCWGYGPLQIEDIRIGETPLAAFDDVQVETREGQIGDAPLTLYTQQVYEEQLNISFDAPDTQVRTTADNVTFLQVDLVWPQGLFWIGVNGKRQSMGAAFQIDYSPAGANAWTTFVFQHVVLATQDIVRATYGAFVPAGRYDVRVSRLSPENVGDNVVSDTMQWVALRGFRPAPAVSFHAPLALTAIRIRATAQLNGVVDTLNGIVTSRVPAWNGTTWAPNTPSRNCGDLFRHVLQGAANKRPYPDSRIDLVALQGWNDYCWVNGFTYDKPINDAVSVQDLLAEIAAAGRAMVVQKDGKISVVWDEQAAEPVQMFTPRNSWGFEWSTEYVDMPHAWRVKFINAAKGWIDDERIVYDDGYGAGNATKFEGIEFPGVTSTDTVWKHGRYHIAQLRLRPTVYSINADWENLICTRGDRIHVQHDAMLVGLGAGRVTAIDVPNQTVTVDEMLVLEGLVTYAMRFRRPDGTFVVRTFTPPSGMETDVIAFAGTAAMPEVGDLWTYGPLGSDSRVYRVLSIEPQKDASAKISFVDDAPAIYDSDTGAIPAYDSGIVRPVDPFMLPPTTLTVQTGLYQEAPDLFLGYAKLAWSTPRQGRAVRYEVQAYYDGRWRDVATVAIPQTAYEVRGLEGNSYAFRVRTIFDDGAFSGWLQSATVSIADLMTPPADVTGFRISTSGDLATLSWDGVTTPGLSHYEIRFVREGGAVSWNTATPLVPKATSTGAQVPAQIGTYLIKAVRVSGVMSINAVTIQSNVLALTGLNVIEVVDDAPAWPGTHDGTEVGVDNGLRLHLRNVWGNWESFDDVISFQVGDGDDDSIGMEIEGRYTFADTIDLGDVYTPIRLGALIEAVGEDPYNTWGSWLSFDTLTSFGGADPQDWSVELQYRSTQVDPVLDDWSPWQPFVSGDVTARALQFRLRLRGRQAENPDVAYANVTPVVYSAEVTIDMPDETRAGNDIAVGTPGLAVAFAPPFRALSGIGIAAQNLATGDRAAITAKTASGFTIRFYDSGGAPVARTFDYVAKGYGRVLA